MKLRLEKNQARVVGRALNYYVIALEQLGNETDLNPEVEQRIAKNILSEITKKLEEKGEKIKRSKEKTKS